MKNNALAAERPPLMLTEADRDRLLDLAEAALERVPDVAQRLLDEADRAVVTPADKLPPKVVAMNSYVEFRDEASGELRRVQLVYPGEADIDAGRISILTLIGAALIGLSEGQSIAWPTRQGQDRLITVTKVSREPF